MKIENCQHKIMGGNTVPAAKSEAYFSIFITKCLPMKDFEKGHCNYNFTCTQLTELKVTVFLLPAHT